MDHLKMNVNFGPFIYFGRISQSMWWTILLGINTEYGPRWLVIFVVRLLKKVLRLMEIAHKSQ